VSDISLLLVDGDESFRRHAGAELAHAGYRVETAAGLAVARRLLASRQFRLTVLDVRLADGSGLDLLSEIKESSPATEVVVLTPDAASEEAVRAMKQGACDILSKPFKMEALVAVLENALQKEALERSHFALEREVARARATNGFIGQSPAVMELLDLVGRVAETDATVLIRGESGVGKELIANAVHRRSLRARQPFVVVDCASLHENLLQSELFGHERGAFTDAVQRKRGLFEVADGGTLFLDEIGELTPPLEVKLLRVLETGTFRRLGGTTDIRVDVRVIAATSRSLEQMVRERGFREDLFYRLDVFSLYIPALRERREDLPLLVEHFIRTSALASKRHAGVSEAAMAVMLRYPWPGNVRELRNVVERALILCDSGQIEPEHLPLSVRHERSAPTAPVEEQRLTLDEMERRYILEVVEECQGHRHRAADILGISERSLYRKLKEYGLSPNEPVNGAR
jgi:two-component system, NtrC family, response regulator HydG